MQRSDVKLTIKNGEINIYYFNADDIFVAVFLRTYSDQIILHIFQVNRLDRWFA